MEQGRGHVEGNRREKSWLHKGTGAPLPQSGGQEVATLWPHTENIYEDLNPMRNGKETIPKHKRQTYIHHSVRKVIFADHKSLDWPKSSRKAMQALEARDTVWETAEESWGNPYFFLSFLKEVTKSYAKNVLFATNVRQYNYDQLNGLITMQYKPKCT